MGGVSVSLGYTISFKRSTHGSLLVCLYLK
jgi:hypothetical protein